VVADELSIKGSGNIFDLDDAGTLSITSDFDASMAGFNFNAGGSLSVGGSLTGMLSASIESNRTIGIAGTWNEHSNNTVVVGGTTSENTLDIAGGGYVSVSSLQVGTSSNSSDNVVSVSGQNALLDVSDVIYVGSTNNSGNRVDVSGGKVFAGNGISVSGTNNFFNLDGGHLVVNADFDVSTNGFKFNAGTLETRGELTGWTNAMLSGRSIVLSGTNAAWNLGTNALSMNAGTIDLTGGAFLASTNISLISESTIAVSGSVWSNAGSVVVGDGGDNNALWITDGGQVFSTDATIGFSGDGNQASVSGSNSLWAVAGMLTVGTNGSYNSLNITNGGQLESISGAIGFGGIENHILVTGTDSVWTNSGNLAVYGAGNSLQVANEGRVGVGQTLSLNNGAELAFSSGGQVSASNYFQDATSTLSFDSVTNAADASTALLVVDDKADFAAGATLHFTGEIEDLGVNVAYTNLLVKSGTLIVNSSTNAATGDLDVLNALVNGSLLAMDFFSLTDDLYGRVQRARLADIAGFEDGTDMAGVSDEIDQMATDGNEAAINQLNILTQLSGASMNNQLSQLYDRNAPTYEHIGGMLEGFKQTRQRGIMPDSLWPIGARGPHLYGDQVQGWIKGYGSWGNRDGSRDFSDYDQSIYGMVIGVDKVFGDLLAGLAGGYASSDISQDDGDDSTADTGYGLLYASWGTRAWFADLNVGYGRSSIDTRSGTLFDTSAEFSANQLAYYIGGGKEMTFKNDQLFLTPSAGLLGSYYAQEKYTEDATTAVPRDVDAYDRWSMQSELGIKVSFEREYDRFVLMPETHASWLHEFNSDEQDVDYSLVGGTGDYTFHMQAPVDNLFEVGLGLAVWTENKEGVIFEWALGLDARFGDGYSASAFNARLLCEF
jgi:outer membrane autotransporter protein